MRFSSFDVRQRAFRDEPPEADRGGDGEQQPKSLSEKGKFGRIEGV
jgi:hypothetical protein